MKNGNLVTFPPSVGILDDVWITSVCVCVVVSTSIYKCLYMSIYLSCVQTSATLLPFLSSCSAGSKGAVPKGRQPAAGDIGGWGTTLAVRLPPPPRARKNHNEVTLSAGQTLRIKQSAVK